MKLDSMSCKASIKCLDVSHYKLNDVAKMIVGMHVTHASMQLLFCNRRGAVALRKLLFSCMANAEHNHGLNVNNLIVKSADVGKAMMLRRSMPRGRGRMARIEKRYSNVTLVLRQVSESAESTKIKGVGMQRVKKNKAL